MKTTTLCINILLMLHVQPTAVSQEVQCYASFSLTKGTCGDLLGLVPLDDCCMNPNYGYQATISECKSCRLASWTEWSRWSSCSVTCTIGVTQRRRACYGIGKCQDTHHVGSVQTKPCEDIDCCPENGGWSEWNAWQPCSVTCESGIKKRTRTCSEPPPKCGGTCQGNSSDTDICHMKNVCPTHGGWSSWSNFGPCAGTCQVEESFIPEKERQRTCTNPSPSVEPRGNDCSGPSTEHQKCTGLPFCPVHGNWGSWSGESDCSVTCGVGRQTQHRQCNSPAPKNRGLDCLGNATKTFLCTILVNCPVDGFWSEWTAWTTCESPNNKAIKCLNRAGKRRRTRDCLGRDYNGSYCPASTVDYNRCYDIDGCKCVYLCSPNVEEITSDFRHIRNMSCRRNLHFAILLIGFIILCVLIAGPKELIQEAFWSEWSEWSYCEPDCGPNSAQTRKRVCTPDISKYRETNTAFSGTPIIRCPELLEKEQNRPCLNVPEC